MKNNNKWEVTKHILAFFTAIALWIVSIVFSYKGFNLDSGQSMAWVGVIMAIAITVLELIFNSSSPMEMISDKKVMGEYLLLLGGLLAYLYDVYTNVLGMYASQANPSPMTWNMSLIVPVLVGMFIAILPEPLFIWAFAPVHKPEVQKQSVQQVQQVQQVQYKPSKPIHAPNKSAERFRNILKNQPPEERTYRYDDKTPKG